MSRLRALARRRSPAERCDLCGKEIAEHHDHLMQPATRQLLCACGACALLFAGETTMRYKRVPRGVQALTDFVLSDARWDDLRLPINLAFFFESSAQGRIIAAYPSPAGATESLLSLEAWADIRRLNPVLDQLESDVEALLVNRVGYARAATPAEYFRTPIDRCFQLVGLIRSGWKGLSGGTDVWRDIARFFADLKAEAAGIEGGIHA